MSAFTSVIQHRTGSPSTAIRQQEEIKGIQFGKEEVKLLLSADGMILYMENPKDFTKKLWKLINKFIEITAYKINIQKSIAFLYSSNEQSKRKI